MQLIKYKVFKSKSPVLNRQPINCKTTDDNSPYRTNGSVSTVSDF